MIIHEPQITQEGNEVCVSSKIESQNAGPSTPDSLWWRFDSKYKEFVTARSDAFVVAMLPVVMMNRENLEVRGKTKWMICDELN